MQNETKNPIVIKDALLPLPYDSRDYSLHAVLGAADFPTIPTEDFDVAEPLEIKDQVDLDFCTGFGTSETAEDQVGVPLGALWQFAKIKQILNNWQSYGADLRTAAKSRIQFGSIAESSQPFTYPDQTRDFLANWANWPIALDDEGAKNKAESFFTVDGPYDLFDNIRVALDTNKAEKCSMIVGSLWYPAWSAAQNGIIPLAYDKTLSSGHCFKIFGQVTIAGESEPRLKAQLSNSIGFGDKGIFYFPRSVVNAEFGPYGQYLFHPMSQEQAQTYSGAGVNVNDPWYEKAWKLFIYKLKQI